MSGGMISGFELIEKLGEGGMGSVFKAKQISLDRMVALKILPPDLSNDADEIERFKLEARSAAKLSHPGIVQVYETGGHHGVFYIVMEFIDGYNAGEWIRRDDKLSQADTLFIADSVAKGLQYAWDKHNIIHRDIKPDNILIDADGTIKLADLGLAKIVGSKDAALAVDDMCTPHYCSPEQAAAEKISDPSSDIYSLGATMYHMVTGQLPFDNPEDPLAPLEGHANEYLPDPRKFNSKLSTKFVLLVAKMMAKEKEDRYPSWADLLVDIGRVNTNKVLAKPVDQKIFSTIKIDPNKAAVRSTRIGTQAGRSSGTQATPRRQKSRKKSNPALLIVLLALFACGLALAVYSAGGPERQALAQQAQLDQNAGSELQRIQAYSSRNRDKQNKVISDLQAALRKYKGSSHTAKVKRAIADAEQKRDRSIRNIMADLKKKAEVQISLKNYADAAAIYSDYEGPYSTDTAPERKAAASKIKTPRTPTTTAAARPTPTGDPATEPTTKRPPRSSLHPDMLKFNQVYITRANSIQKDLQTSITGMQSQYASYLEKLEAKAKQAGNLDAVLQIQAERKRFDTDKDWPAAVISDLPAMAHKNYESAMSYEKGYEEKRDKDLRTLNAAYANQVSGLIKRLTSDGKIDEAVKLQDRFGSRIDGWSTSSRVLFKNAQKGPKGNKA